jgi:4-hydroxy-3-methylbut-2-enyl diphosphate reductase
MTSSSTESRATEAKTLLLLKPRGFCAGVVRAIDIVRIALETFGAPIYVRKEIVHNRHVVDELAAKGAIFVDSVEDVPNGARVIYSAHGVAPEVREASKKRGLRVIDATCPLVTKVHVEAINFAKKGYSLILVGHRDHDEVIGTLGEAPDVTQVVGSPKEVNDLTVPDPDRIAYLTQTTLSLDEAMHIVEALKKKFPKIQGPKAQDICYATENRQVAVKNVVAQPEYNHPELLLVVGSENSSNSNRLVEVGMNLGSRSFLIENYRSIEPAWLVGVKTVALTAGASAPEVLVQETVEYLASKGFTNVQEVEVMPENVRFGLPPEIVAAIQSAPTAAAAAE